MTRELIDGFKKSMSRYIIPLGVGFALPYLYEKNSRLYLLIPLIERLKNNSDGTISLKKPVGELRFDLKTKRLIQFKLYFYDDILAEYDWKTEFAKFPSQIAIKQGWSIDKYYKERDNYYDLVDIVYEHWKSKKYYADKTAIQKLKFEELVEEGMDKYYSLISM